jgi:hypothetical protein
MRSFRPGFVLFCYSLLPPGAMDYMILKSIVISIAAASIALAAPAYADNGKTVCTSMGNGTTHALAMCPLARGSHTQAHATYLLPRGNYAKP